MAETVNGYCVKCKTKRDFVKVGEKTHKNKMVSHHGSCPSCGTKIHRFVGKAK